MKAIPEYNDWFHRMVGVFKKLSTIDAFSMLYYMMDKIPANLPFNKNEIAEMQAIIKTINCLTNSQVDRLMVFETKYETLLAAEMLEKDGISAEVVNIHTIKPIDKELVIASATKTGKVVTVEEHFTIGGLGSAVCEVLSENAPTKVLRIGVDDVFGESGPALELIHKYELDAEGIYKKVKAFVK
jgi:deoxyxylulose-5-phosphate synthase